MPSLNSDALEKAKQRFQHCWNVREGWDDLLQRQFEVELQPELRKAQEGIDYETPDLEKALFDHIDVLIMNPTFYDVAPLSSSLHAKAEGREILQWTARGWEYENRNRWLDRVWAEGQVRHGYKITRLMHRPQTEDIKASTPQEIMEEREEAMKRRRHPFFWKDCSIYNCAWVGDERNEYGPDVFFEFYKIPYVEAVEQFSRDDKKWSLEKEGKVAWLGAEEQEGDSHWTGESVSVVVVDARDTKNRKCPLPGCSHYQRVIRIYVGPNDACIDDDHLVSESDSPFPGCSFFVIGSRMSADPDPNRRFRPLIHPLYPEGQLVNYITTLELTEIRNDYSNNDLYYDYGNSKPEMMPEDRENWGVMDFDATDGKIQGFPAEIKRIPKAISPHLQVLRQDHSARLDSFKPNRFVTGSAYTEASNATGTAFIQQAQQAALPYNTLLGMTDEAQLRSREYEYHAIKFWSLAEPEDAATRYYAAMTGNMSVRISGEQPRAGHVTYVDAKRLELDFDLAIRTKSETLAEEGARWSQAKDQFAFGAIDEESLFRAAGVDDIQSHKERLDRLRQAATVEPEFQLLSKQMHWRYFYSKTGVDPSQFLGQPTQQPQRTGGPSQNGVASSPPGTNVGGVAPTKLMGRQLSQPMVAGPDGGGSPVR